MIEGRLPPGVAFEQLHELPFSQILLTYEHMLAEQEKMDDDYRLYEKVASTENAAGDEEDRDVPTAQDGGDPSLPAAGEHSFDSNVTQVDENVPNLPGESTSPTS